MYVAAKRIKVKAFDGSYEFRNVGEPVPEAAEWSYVYKWLNEGHIRLAPKQTKAPQSPPKVIKVTPKLETQAETTPDAFGCPSCDRVFKTLSGMRRHKSTIHNKKRKKKK